MKKIFSVTVVLAIAMSFIGCSGLQGLMTNDIPEQASFSTATGKVIFDILEKHGIDADVDPDKVYVLLPDDYVYKEADDG